MLLRRLLVNALVAIEIVTCCAGHEAVASDTSQNPFLRFRQEVIDRGRVVCWICFIKDGGVLTERDEKIDRCPVHIKNNWNPMLVWPSGSSWASVRPRHVLSKATGLFGVCRRGPDCCGPRDCRRPHNKTEKDAWTLDRDGSESIYKKFLYYLRNVPSSLF